MRDQLPSAEVSALLFRCSERLDKYVHRARRTDTDFWGAIIAQLDTIASVIAEQDEICDGCGLRRATGTDMSCNECREAA